MLGALNIDNKDDGKPFECGMLIIFCLGLKALHFTPHVCAQNGWKKTSIAYVCAVYAAS